MRKRDREGVDKGGRDQSHHDYSTVGSHWSAVTGWAMSYTNYNNQWTGTASRNGRIGARCLTLGPDLYYGSGSVGSERTKPAAADPADVVEVA